MSKPSPFNHPAPAALDVTLGERGTVLDFKRSVQVDGGKPMVLKLDIKPQQGGGWFYAAIVSLLGAGVLVRGSRTRAALA